MANENEQTTKSSTESISLSQAILAPLDAIFKAQIHAARSYVNMLWQMAYPHIPVDEKGTQVKFKNAYEEADHGYVFEDFDGTFFTIDEDGKRNNAPDFNPQNAKQTDLRMPYPFPINFKVDEPNGGSKEYQMNVPAIAMVPTVPLGIEEATIKFSMSYEGTEVHKQMQGSETKKFGKADGNGFKSTNRPWYLVDEPRSIKGTLDSSTSSSNAIEVSIKLTKSPVPAALEKAMTVLTQSISIGDIQKTPAQNELN